MGAPAPVAMPGETLHPGETPSPCLGDSGSSPVTSTTGWHPLGERTQNTVTSKAQGARAPLARPGRRSFFLQSIYMRKATFNGDKNYFGGRWGTGGCPALLFPLRPAKPCLFPGTFLALLWPGVQGGR